MADTSIEIDVRKALAEITELREGLQAVQGEMRKVSALGKAAFDVGAEGVAREARAIDQLQKEYAELKQATQTLRTAAAGAWDPRAVERYTKEIAHAEAGLKKLERAAKDTGVNLKAAHKEASTGTQVFEQFFGTLTKATIIVAVLDQVRKLAGRALELADNYTKAQRSFAAFLGSTERADQVLASLNKTAQDNFLPVENVQQAGKALLAFGESADNLPSVLTRIANIAAATGKDFNELAVIYGKARTSGVLYAEDLNQLTEAGIPIIEEFANQMGVSTGEVKKLASEGKIGFNELELAFANLTKEGSQFAGQAAAAATESDKLSASFDKFATAIGTFIKPAVDSLKESLRGILDGLTDLAKSQSLEEFGNNFITLFERINPIAGQLGAALRRALGIKTAQEAGADIGPDIKRQNQLSRQAFEDQEEIFFNAEKKRKELAAGSLEQQKKEAEARRKQRESELRERQAEARALEQLAVQRLAPGTEARELAEENLRHQNLLREFQKFNLDTEDIEKQHRQNLLNIQAKFFIQRIEKQDEANQHEKDLVQAGLDELAALEEDNKKRRSSAAETNLKAQSDAADLEAALFEQGLLNARAVFFQKKRTDEEIDKYNQDVAKQREIFQLQLQQKELQRTLDFGQDLSSAEKAVLEQRIKNIGTQIEQAKAGVGTNQGNSWASSIWSLFGLDPEDDADQIEKIKQGVGELIGVINQLTEARVREAEAAVQAADDRVQAAEDALDREIQLGEAGFASNVALRQKELADAQAAREQALQQQKQAQRQQLAVDTITQASGIATSVANIIKGWSEVPFVGFILAAAQVAAMFALITSTRARAKAISTQQFRTGGSGYVDENGIIVGPSHEAGGVVVPEYQGGEFFGSDGKRFAVVNRKMTAKHFELLRAINSDDRIGMAAALRRLTSGPSLRRDIELPGSAAAGAAGNTSSSDGFSAAERRELLSLLREHKKGSAARPVVTVEGNTTVIRRGNHTRTIRNN